LRPLRVVVVDDSVLNRRTLAELLSSMPGVEVIGKAADGEEALRLVLHQKPDLVTLDLEMPKMDGFTFLRLVMARQPTAVLVVSGRSDKTHVFKALELGALDFIVKPSSSAAGELAKMRSTLEEKVAMVRQLRPVTGVRETVTGVMRLPQLRGARPAPADPVPRRVVVIGASTGGPPALVDIFSKLPSDLPATVLIAQHMPERFTRTFAERLEKIGGLRVAELEDREPLRAGRALICPGGRCLELSRQGSTVWVRVASPDPEDRYVPSVDRLFRTAATALGPRVVGVVLTGMGDDGARGAEWIRRFGGTVIAEAEETAAIFGMPGSVQRIGLADKVLPLHAVADEIVRLCATAPDLRRTW
jgi:two-component system chemotaxis response regulator CheB